MARQQLDDMKKEYELKLDEYARLLDIRAARIKACHVTRSSRLRLQRWEGVDPREGCCVVLSN